MSANPFTALSRCERRVLMELASGRPIHNKALAARLMVSKNTIGTQMTAILRKLGYVRRSQAASAAFMGALGPFDAEIVARPVADLLNLCPVCGGAADLDPASVWKNWRVGCERDGIWFGWFEWIEEAVKAWNGYAREFEAVWVAGEPDNESNHICLEEKR